MQKSRMDAFDDLVLALFTIAGCIVGLVISTAFIIFLFILGAIFRPKIVPWMFREIVFSLKTM